MSFNTSGSSWLSQSPVILYNIMPPGVGTYQSAWFDARNLKRAVIDINSTLDQNVIVQLVGNINQNFTTAKNKNGPKVAPTGGCLEIGIGTSDDWQPYIAVVIITTAPASSGTLVITAQGQG